MLPGAVDALRLYRFRPARRTAGGRSTAPAVALYFKTLGHEDWFYYYLSGMIFLSLIIYATMRDTKHASAMHRHE